MSKLSSILKKIYIHNICVKFVDKYVTKPNGYYNFNQKEHWEIWVCKLTIFTVNTLYIYNIDFDSLYVYKITTYEPRNQRKYNWFDDKRNERNDVLIWYAYDDHT